MMARTKKCLISLLLSKMMSVAAGIRSDLRSYADRYGEELGEGALVIFVAGSDTESEGGHRIMTDGGKRLFEKTAHGHGRTHRIEHDIFTRLFTE